LPSVLQFIFSTLSRDWLVDCQRLALDCRRVHAKEQYRPGKKDWFLYVFSAMDVLLGLLQVYWFGIAILPKILKNIGKLEKGTVFLVKNRSLLGVARNPINGQVCFSAVRW
jgi:hypothetical protein